jgi:t-SNARE complex subunit (syntaxin)
MENNKYKSKKLELELELELDIIRERELEIVNINHKAIILNEILKDLAIIVDEQAIPIVHIRENVVKSKQKTGDAVSELIKAEKGCQLLNCSII